MYVLYLQIELKRLYMVRKMKKILFIIWSNTLGGGAETLLTTIVNNLNPQKYQIGIIEFYHSTIKKERLNKNIKIHESISFGGDKDYQKKLYYVHRESDRIIQRYIPKNYDLYVSFNYQIPSFLLPKGTRNVSWIHGPVFDLAEEGMESYWYLQDKAFEKVAKIVSVSDITTNSIQALFPRHKNKIVQIYNGIDIKTVRQRADSFTEIILQHPAVICVGRLDDNKNPLRILDIFNGINTENYCVHLYFLGNGELESQILERAYEYELQDRVHILGYIDNPFPVMKQADVCCMTSKMEGFGMILLESATLHVPFVSTDVGIARVLSNGGSCGRVYATNKEALRSIIELLNTSKDLIGKECEKSISRFDLNTYIARIEMLFDDLLKKEIVLKKFTAWDKREDIEMLEDRSFYYRFPEGTLPEGSKVILYGAGDIGVNYYNYISEATSCRIVAWVDASAEKYRKEGKDIKDIDVIFHVEFDIILIALMKKEVSQSIRENLCREGVPDNKIVWVPPIL